MITCYAGRGQTCEPSGAAAGLTAQYFSCVFPGNLGAAFMLLLKVLHPGFNFMISYTEPQT